MKILFSSLMLFVCVVSAQTVSFTVASSGPAIPALATVVKSVQGLNNWRANFDTGTNGSASGTTSLKNTPSLSGPSRQFITTSSGYGGVRYSVDFGRDPNATHFVYDGWIYLARPASAVANIELDMNQVLANGQVIIYGFQCDGWSKTWDYTENAGTPSNPKAHWIHSTKTCDPHSWTVNTWHHVQIEYLRDSSGNVTYQSVWLNGVKQDIGAKVRSAFNLGWGSSLITNFQIDGATSTSSSSTVYLDNLKISRW